MADEQTPTDALADLIAQHVVEEFDGGLLCHACLTRWSTFGEYAAHLAAVVRASDTTTSEGTRGGWDEGYAAGRRDERREQQENARLAASGVPLGGTTREQMEDAWASATVSGVTGSTPRRFLAALGIDVRPVPAPARARGCGNGCHDADCLSGGPCDEPQTRPVPAPDDQQTGTPDVLAAVKAERDQARRLAFDNGHKADAARADLAALRDGVQRVTTMADDLGALPAITHHLRALLAGK